MDRKAIILGKKIVSRKETLGYAAEKFNWRNVIIGISCFFGFWAWVLARLISRKCIYYCIDFYSPVIPINKTLKNRVFCWAAMQMDKFLIRVCDEVWDISERINEGRQQFGNYFAHSTIVPLSYPPSYFRFHYGKKERIVFVGLDPYGLELLPFADIEFIWLGKDKLLPLPDLLFELSCAGIGISLWQEKGNNYYGDPGKTKLYSACGLPVIMTNNTPYAKIIKETEAGIVIDYDKEQVKWAIKMILENYDFYKNNVKKTWEYINSDEVFKNCGLNR